ncbi:MAG TPA: LysR family transcriptional regulator [Paraburkholderia sp.]
MAAILGGRDDPTMVGARTGFVAVDHRRPCEPAAGHVIPLAARKTGESQSAISKAVNALEKRLGVALLHRSTRKMALTDQGQQYYERTKPLVDEIRWRTGS